MIFSFASRSEGGFFFFRGVLIIPDYAPFWLDDAMLRQEKGGWAVIYLGGWGKRE